MSGGWLHILVRAKPSLDDLAVVRYFESVEAAKGITGSFFERDSNRAGGSIVVSKICNSCCNARCYACPGKLSGERP